MIPKGAAAEAFPTEYKVKLSDLHAILRMSCTRVFMHDQSQPNLLTEQ